MVNQEIKVKHTYRNRPVVPFFTKGYTGKQNMIPKLDMKALIEAVPKEIAEIIIEQVNGRDIAEQCQAIAKLYPSYFYDKHKAAKPT